jgi:DNA-binding NarL/FixJ family response regulator
MSSLRILIADDHYLVRRGLRSLVDSRAGWEICGEAVDGREAVTKCRQLKPDLLILDICMPKLNGVDAARQILQARPTQSILIVTDVDSEEVIRECLALGVRGWVWKSDGCDDLILAIEKLQNHGTFLTPSVAELVLSSYLRKAHNRPAETTVARLSPREREVVQLISEGSTTKEVASILHMAVNTAETHRNNSMRKLGIHSIAELVLYAVRNNIVQIHLAAAPLADTKPNDRHAYLVPQEDHQLLNRGPAVGLAQRSGLTSA